jgi:hypothetical protein
MDQPNRIDPLSFTVTGRRQTPKNEFGQVLATTLSSAVKAGAGIVGSLPGVPVVSAAVNAITGIVASGPSSPSAVTSQSAQTAQGVVQLGGGGAAMSGGAVSGTGAPDRPVYTDPTVREMAAMSDYYMKLQNEMQRESREYNAVSNIIKVRHDSAKAAINNIR